MPRLILVTGALLVISACSSTAPVSPRVNATLFEGARLIAGEEIAPIENSAFLIEGDTVTRVGRKGEVPLPDGATRVDLTGKTVMPAIINAHGHMGYRKGASFAVENYTRENIIDHLERLAYHGVAAVMSMGAERELGYALRDELQGVAPPEYRALSHRRPGTGDAERWAGASVARRALRSVHRGRGTQGGSGAPVAEGRRLRQDLGGRSRRHGAEAAERALRGRDRRGAQERPPHRHAYVRAGRREGDPAEPASTALRIRPGEAVRRWTRKCSVFSASARTSSSS